MKFKRLRFGASDRLTIKELGQGTMQTGCSKGGSGGDVYTLRVKTVDEVDGIRIYHSVEMTREEAQEFSKYIFEHEQNFFAAV